MNKDEKIRKITLTGAFAAIICLTTAFLFHIPTGTNGGYIHLGDSFIYLAASILPLPYAMIASAIGASLADIITGSAIWALPTFVIKPLVAIWFTSKCKKIINKRNLIAIFLGGATGVVLYAFVNAYFYGSIITAIVSSLLGLLQPIGSGVAYLFMGTALDKIHIKEKICTNAKKKEVF